MKKKILCLGVICVLVFILLQSCCFAQTVSGRNKYYQIELPDSYNMWPSQSSIMGDITKWEIPSISSETFDGIVNIHSYEKYNQQIKYNPELNYNGIYCLNGYSLGDLNKAIKSQNTFLTKYYTNIKFLHKDLLTINGYPAQRVTYKNNNYEDYYMDIYTIEADNHIAWICFDGCKKSFIDSKTQQDIINSFRFTNDTVNNVMNLPFSDVLTTDWYNNAVRYVYKNKIIKGTTATTFKPNNKLTRGQLATIIWRMEGSKKVTNGKNFSDVKNTDYYYDAVRWASANKIVNGYSNGRFGADDNITREQLAVMLQNYARYKKKNTTKVADISKYKDVTGVSSYAVDAVKWAIGNKVISGKSNGTRIDPKGNATRAEASAMIQNYCINIK